jgi:hypothetical protein
MNKKITILLLLSATLFFTACQKNLDLFVPDPAAGGPDTTWYTAINNTMPVTALQTSLALTPIKDSFEITSSVTASLLNTGGLQCTFPPLCCVSSTTGQPVTGRIQAEVLVLRKKGDMVLMNKPTTSNGQMLVSAGQFLLRLKKDGQDISLAPGAKILVRYADLPINPLMKLFFGEEQLNGQFNWQPNNDTLNNFIGFGQQAYEINTNRLNWINLDYFYDTAGVARAAVSVQLPFNYTNANTTAFLVFKDIRSVLRINANVAEKRFVSGKVPNGKAAWVVILSKQGNDYFMSKEAITTGTNNTSGTQALSLTPVKTSLAEIKAWLATL